MGLGLGLGLGYNIIYHTSLQKRGPTPHKIRRSSHSVLCVKFAYRGTENYIQSPFIKGNIRVNLPWSQGSLSAHLRIVAIGSPPAMGSPQNNPQ